MIMKLMSKYLLLFKPTPGFGSALVILAPYLPNVTIVESLL